MKIRNILPLLAFLSFLFVSCDNIDDNNRLINDDKVPPIPDVSATVLLEEFTGQGCPNCPTASDIAHGLQNNLGEQLIIVNIHAGSFARGSELGSETSTAYHDHFYTDSQKAYPAGMISRTSSGGSRIYKMYQTWDTDVMSRLNSDFLKDREFVLSIEPEYSAEDNSVIVYSEITTIDPLSGVTLQLWLTESHIVLPQSMPDGSKKNDYEHNHVLRDAINGLWGDEVPPLNAGITHEMEPKLYSFEDKTWKPENMDVVGFVRDSNTMEILYVIEKKLINN